MASQMNLREEAKAKSRTFSAWKTHVFLPVAGVVSLVFASSGVTMKVGVRLPEASWSLSSCSGLRTSSLF